MHTFIFGLPLHGRIGEEQLDILKILFKFGGDFTIVDDASGQTVIHFAVQRDQAVLNCILQTTSGKLPLDVLDQEGRSPLWCALIAGKLEAAQSLVIFNKRLKQFKNQLRLMPALMSMNQVKSHC